MARRNSKRGSAATPAAVFGSVLRHAREEALYTQDALAVEIPCDRSLITKIERGERRPDEAFAVACDRILGTGDRLAVLWREIDWWPVVEHPDWFKRRAALDEECVELCEFQTHVLPGLLQTREYARAIFSRDGLDDEKQVEDKVTARLSRQTRFLEPDGPLMVTVLDESCLRRVVGDPSVMRGQYEHLLLVGELPNVRVQIAPFDRPYRVHADTSLSLLTLPDGETWVYSESLDRGHLTDNPAIVAQHRRTYDLLRADALSARESAAWIRGALKEHHHHDRLRSDDRDVAHVQLQRGQRRQLHRGSPRMPRRRPRT